MSLHVLFFLKPSDVIGRVYILPLSFFALSTITDLSQPATSISEIGSYVWHERERESLFSELNQPLIQTQQVKYNERLPDWANAH